ncbi:hypothetical protein BDV18DRAFT_158254 [Aspergillus unguis]
MASIPFLLNPAPEPIRPNHYPFPTPSPTNSTSTVMLRSPRHKKQKMAKDAPIFQRGKPRGDVNYPPQEVRRFANELREFRVHPCGNIADYPRHIPYNSDKKTFQERTGRESFEVFQYTFQLPGEETKWTVMWDYNIGLVRTTSLFKCNEYSKTTPAKMLNQNPGLRDICHSITGGALAAQGYWMPYEAAKAVAATFCWRIRFALIPLFGEDFPDSCISPDDRSRFGRMVIDPSVVQLATQKANDYRMLELQYSSLKSLRASHHNDGRPSSAPGSDQTRERENLALGRHLFLLKNQRSRTSIPTDTSSVGYGSSPEMEYYSSAPEPYCISPVSPDRNSFTPVNAPRSVDIYPPPSNYLPSPHEVLASMSSSASVSSSSTSRARSKAKGRAFARARAGSRVTPSSVPSTYTSASTTAIPSRSTSRTRFPASVLPSPVDGSDMDADAETDLDNDGDLDYETGSSDTSSTSSTASSSATASSMGIGSAANGPCPSYRDARPQQALGRGISIPDSPGPTTALSVGQKRTRHGGVDEYPRRREYARAHPYSNARPSGRQAHAQSSSDSRLMCEMTAAHALISLMQEAIDSDADTSAGGGAARKGHIKPLKEDVSTKGSAHHAGHSHSPAHKNSNISRNMLISSGYDQKRVRRASA